MAISGTWSERFANAQAYTGAKRWGTGYNPVHGVRDNPGKVIGTRENLLPLGDTSDVVSDNLLSPDDYVTADWGAETPYPGEDFRYQDTEPRWGTDTQFFRGATASPEMGEWASWGVYNDPNAYDGFPLPGPTGGMDRALDVSHGEDQERQRAIAAPTRQSLGGWQNKFRMSPALASQTDAQEILNKEAQWAVNTGQRQDQGVQSMDNGDVTGAVARGTDAARTPILSRVAGMRNYQPATSFGMGGGPGTPDMQPFQQTAGLKRPWVTRKAAIPPMEPHYMNEMEGRAPIQRTVPPDPYQGDPEVTGQTGGTDAIYDYGAPDDGGDVDWGY